MESETVHLGFFLVQNLSSELVVVHRIHYLPVVHMESLVADVDEERTSDLVMDFEVHYTLSSLAAIVDSVLELKNVVVLEHDEETNCQKVHDEHGDHYQGNSVVVLDYSHFEQEAFQSLQAGVFLEVLHLRYLSFNLHY